MKHFFHKWGKWKQYEIDVNLIPGILAPDEIRGKILKTIEIRQQRYCKKCNKMQDILVREY